MPTRPDFYFDDSGAMQELAKIERFHWDSGLVPIAADTGLRAIMVDHGTAPGQVFMFNEVDGLADNPSRPTLEVMVKQVRERLMPHPSSADAV